MIEPGKPRPRVGLLRPIVHAAEALDRHTVQVTLQYPSPSFLPLLAVDYMKVVPKHVVEARRGGISTDGTILSGAAPSR